MVQGISSTVPKEKESNSSAFNYEKKKTSTQELQLTSKLTLDNQSLFGCCTIDMTMVD